MNPHERRILTVTCFAHFLSHYNMLVFPAIVLPLAGLLNLDMASILALSFWMYLMYGLSALPWGLAADRWGPRPLLLLFHAGASASGFLAALFIDTPAGLMASLTALGIFSGIYHPAGLGLISKSIKRISLGLAYNGMFGNLGIALAPLLTGIATWLWGPRAAYIMLALLNLGGALLVLVFFRQEKPLPENGPVADEGVLLSPFLILLAAMMLCGIAYRGSTVILPALFELKNHQIVGWLSTAANREVSSNLVATASASIIYLIGMLGQYTGGRVAERYDLKMCYLIFHAIPIPVAFLIVLSANVPLLLLATVYFFFLLGMQPIENTLVARYTPQKFRHAAYGTKFILVFGVGALAVKLIQYIEAHVGIAWVFPALGCVSLGLVCVILLLIAVTRNGQEKTIS